MTELRRPEPLDGKRHNRASFTSSERDLDDWLRRYASQNRRRDTAATWVIADPTDRVVAYVSIAMTGIDRSAAPQSLAHHAPDPVPVLLIGRLAVDLSVTGHGVGTALIAHVLATAVDLNQRAACRAVVASALHDQESRWWKGLGFHPFDASDPDNLDLYLLASEIEATLRSL